MSNSTDSTVPAKRALIVAGMHRSGTSATTRVLNLLGADLPARLMPGGKDDNDLGYWESLDIVEIHDQLLSSAKSSWDAIGPLDNAWFQSDSAVRARERILEVLARDFSNSQLFVIKDPRICRLVPLWLPILKQFGARPYFLIPIRHPLEVAASLRERNQFPTQKSLLLWLWHILEVERATRKSSRAFLSFTELLHDWRATVDKIERELGISLPKTTEGAEATDAFISPRYRRHAARTEDLDSRPGITSWVARVYDAVGKTQDDPALFRRELNQVRRELLLAHSAYGPVLGDLTAHLGNTQSELTQLTKALTSRMEDLANANARGAKLSGKLSERQAAIERLTLTLNDRDTMASQASERSGQLVGQLKERQTEIDRLTTALHERDTKLERSGQLVGQLKERQTEIDRLTTALHERDTALERLTLTLNDRDVMASQASERSGQLVGQLKERQTEIDRLTTALHDRDAKLGRQAKKRHDRDAELKEAGHLTQRLTHDLEALNNDLGELKSSLKDRDERLRQANEFGAQLAGELAEKERETDGLSLSLAHSEAVGAQQATTLANVLSSSSWTVTRPARALFAFFKRAVSAVQALSGASKARRRTLQQSGLFDPQYYRDQLPPGMSRSGDPLGLYVKGRAPREANPHPLFDTSYYLRRHPEVAHKGLNPLFHFVSSGWAEAASPHPLFAIDFYRQQVSEPELHNEVNPLGHYLEQGAAMGFDPHPLFDTSYYTEEACPGVLEQGFNPLVHFLTFGASERRNPHPLFDTSFYVEQHPELVENGLNPLLHYLEHGSTRGNNPHPLFDTSYYLEGSPELVETGENPLVHYLRVGALEGRDPHPLFDTSYYAEEACPEVFEQGFNPLAHFLAFGAAERRNPHPLFDTSFYVEQHPEIEENGFNPLLHFLEQGSTRGNNPHPLFDTSYYLEGSPELLQTGENPLVHYSRVGALEGRDPHPLFDTSYYAEEACPEVFEQGFNPLAHFLAFGAAEHRNPHPMFDTSFYVEQHPEIEENGLNPLLHFLEHGGTHGNSPHPLFDTSFYVEQHPELVENGLNPLLHFLEHGSTHGNNPHPLFDTSYYLEGSPELVQTGENPLAHYSRVGALEGHDPHPLFDTSYYSEEACPGVLEQGFNPLAHFLAFGAAERRNPHPMFDTSFYVERHPEIEENGLNPLLHFLERTEVPIPRAHRAFDLDFFFEFSKASGWRPRTQTIESLTRLVATKKIAFAAHRSPRLSVVIAVHNQIRFTLQCLRCLSSDHDGVDLEVIVVDDGSSDSTADVLPAIPNLRLLRHDSAQGFIDAANLGASQARGEYLLLLNNDTVMTPGSIEAMLAAFEEFPGAGAVGAKLLFADGTLQEAGAIVWQDGSAWNYGRNQDPSEPQFNYVRRVDYCSASCLMIRREFFERIGAFDRHFRPMYYEDVDLAFRIQDAGKEIYYQPEAEVYHFEGATSGTDLGSGMKSWQVENQVKFVERWKKRLAVLPQNARQPNVSKDRGVTKRALVIDHRLPEPDKDAGSVRMYQITRVFRELDFKVTFIPQNLARTEPYCQNLQREGVEVHYAPFLASMEDHLRSSGDLYDVVLVSRVSVANDLLAAIRAGCPRALVLFDTVDLHYLRLTREAEFRDDPELMKQALLTKYLELSVALQADSTLVVSPAEQDLLLKEDAGLQVDLLPLIYSPVESVVPFSERKDFYFIGGFEHPPNVDAAHWLVREILPLICKKIPKIRLFIVGSKAPKSVLQLASERVTVTGYVDDLAPFLAGCRLSIAPIRFGAGIKGKVTESLAHGLPCVLTTIAAEGIGLINGDSAVIADSKEDIARGVVRVYRDEKLWTRLSAGGQDTIRKSFSFEAARRRLEKIVGRAQGAREKAQHARKPLQSV